MSLVTFTPAEGTDYFDGWPTRVVGNGFIELKLLDWSLDDINDSATYRDQFRDEYEFIGRENGEWTVEVREDG